MKTTPTDLAIAFIRNVYRDPAAAQVREHVLAALVGVANGIGAYALDASEAGQQAYVDSIGCAERHGDAAKAWQAVVDECDSGIENIRAATRRRIRVIREHIASHERGRNAPHEAARSTGLSGSTVLYVRGRAVFL